MVRKLVYILFVMLMMAASAQAVVLPVHQWIFDGDTADTGTIGGANGTLMGGATVFEGYLKNAANGDYLDLPAATIAINTYDAVTIELWETRDMTNQGYSMTVAFGDTDTTSWGWGQQYLALSTVRGDDVARSMITDSSTNPGYQSEIGINSPELNDGLLHHYVMTVGVVPCLCDTPMISLYVDGDLRGMYNIDDNLLSGVSNALAYIGKGMYAGDDTTISDIDEVNIYDQVLDCVDIQALYEAGPTVPEPATMLLLGLGSLALLRRRK